MISILTNVITEFRNIYILLIVYVTFVINLELIAHLTLVEQLRRRKIINIMIYKYNATICRNQEQTKKEINKS